MELSGRKGLNRKEGRKEERRRREERREKKEGREKKVIEGMNENGEIEEKIKEKK